MNATRRLLSKVDGLKQSDRQERMHDKRLQPITLRCRSGRCWVTLALVAGLLSGCNVGPKKTYTANDSAGAPATEAGNPQDFAPSPSPVSQSESTSEIPSNTPGSERSMPPSGQAQSNPSPQAEAGSGAGAGSLSGAAKASRSAPAADQARGPSAQGAIARAPSPAPIPEMRPGLGTSWGESRYSPVSFTSFVRESNQPYASTTIWYNDREGARALAAAGSYQPVDDAVLWSLGNAVTVSLLNEQGQPLPGIRAQGNLYAIGESGQRYSIVLRNLTGGRVEVVTSVDGLDVLDGHTASFSKRGYIVDPYASLEIDGFRRSEAQVAAFRFGSVHNSYVARTGSDRNVGVVGVAVFVERGAATAYPWTAQEVARRRSADPFPNRFASPPR